MLQTGDPTGIPSGFSYLIGIKEAFLSLLILRKIEL
jgi:hypothetical protein